MVVGAVAAFVRRSSLPQVRHRVAVVLVPRWAHLCRRGAVVSFCWCEAVQELRLCGSEIVQKLRQVGAALKQLSTSQVQVGSVQKLVVY